MPEDSLKLRPVAPLANAIRVARQSDLKLTQIKVSEALDLLSANLNMVAARLPQATEEAEFVAVVEGLGYPDRT